MKRIILSVISILIVPFVLYGEGKFTSKEIKDFKTLDQFKSIKDFDKYIGDYEEDCLGTGYRMITCLIKDDIWDRELNISYKKLYNKLDIEGKSKLKSSQKIWLKNRDMNRDMTFYLQDKIDDGTGGSDRRLVFTGDVSDIMTEDIKERVIVLRQWIDITNTDINKIP